MTQSPLFFCRKLLCFPHGNNRNEAVSVFLAVDAPEDQPAGWSRSASFKLKIIDQNDIDQSIVKEARHTFTSEAVDWGFSSLYPLSMLQDQSRGLYVNDTVKIGVEARITHPDDFSSYNSRQETGFVGLKNQGATCYMNSLLQTLYNVNAFRQAVYHMPTSEDEEPSQSMPLALQSVFYKLQFTPGPVSTKDLTMSFGWDTMDAFQQHDVQELNRILCDRLEEKMKGTRVEGTVNKLFEGHTLNYIECINIDYKSSRREAFQDLQLDVKGCNNIYDSFDKYCEVETLEGEDKYDAEGHGKQDAKKGVLFDSLPPVLNLHLKRFEYDYQRDVMIKINDRYEFYEEIDLDKPSQGGKGAPAAYLSPNADRTICNKYKLLAVLVHSGGVHGGHYFAYIRPDGKQWLKFDDETVEKSDEIKSIKDNWGGDDSDKVMGGGGYGNTLRVSRFSNAYMLVYVRESEWDSVMCEVSEEDISEHVRARLKAEQEEKERRRKERAEAHLYTLVRIATDEDFKAQIGNTIYFDLVDFEDVKLTFKVPKKTLFEDIQKEVECRLGVPLDKQRYWRWAQRQNQTYRPSFPPLPPSASSQPLAVLQEIGGRFRHQARPGEMVKFNLYLETPLRGNEGDFIPATPGSSLLFFKYYVPTDSSGAIAPSLSYIGRAIVPRASKGADLHKMLRSRAGLPEDSPLRVMEEVKFYPTVMVEEVGPDATLQGAEIDNGDILVVQHDFTAGKVSLPAHENKENIQHKGLEGEGKEGGAKPEENKSTMQNSANLMYAENFFKYVRSRVTVTFRRIEGGVVVGEDGGGDGVRLDLLKDMKWAQISEALAEKLGLDHPLKLRFTLQSPYTLMPRPYPHRYNPDITLEDLLRTGNPPASGSVLYYETIDLPLPEFERLVTHRVAFHNSRHEEVAAVTVRVPKDCKVRALLEAVRNQLSPDLHKGGPLRLMEVYQWRIWQIFDPDLPVERHLDSAANIWHLRAEVLPDDQTDLDQEGKMHVHCLQVEDKDKNPKIAFPFSDPFVMPLHPTDTVADLKVRVQKEMELSDEEFSTWNVVLVTGMNAIQEPLADDVIISQRLNPADLGPAKLYGHGDRQMLGFHHENKNPRRTHAHIHRASAVAAQDRALKIRA